MGKASSSKKVARAAGTGGGRTNRGSTPWAFVALIALIVVVGAALTFTSRNRDITQKNAATAANASVAPTVGGAAWYEGFGVYICGSFVPAIKVPSDTEGLATDGDGVMHIAPKVKAAAGKNATLAEFAKSIGMTLTSSELRVPGGKLYANGDDCSGKPGKVYIKQFAYAGDPVGVVQTQDPTVIRLADDATVTIAFVPSTDKSKIPAPPSYVTANLKKLTTPTSTTTSTSTTSTSTTSTSTTSTSTTSTTTPRTSSTTSKKGSSTTTGSTTAGTSKKGSSTTTPITGATTSTSS